MQYAHKLVDLVGQHIHRMPSEQVRIYFCAAIIYCSLIKTISLSSLDGRQALLSLRRYPFLPKNMQSFELEKYVRMRMITNV